MDHIRRIYDALHLIRRKLAIGAVSLLAVWLLAHVVFGTNGIVIYQKKKSEYRQVQKQLDDLQKENDALTQRTKALKSDKATIEKEARQQLHYAKPGEVIYLLPADKPADNPPASAAKTGK